MKRFKLAVPFFQQLTGKSDKTIRKELREKVYPGVIQLGARFYVDEEVAQESFDSRLRGSASQAAKAIPKTLRSELQSRLREV